MAKHLKVNNNACKSESNLLNSLTDKNYKPSSKVKLPFKLNNKQSMSIDDLTIDIK